MRYIVLGVVGLLLSLFALSTGYAESQIVAGAGPSEEIAKAFFDEFNKRPEAAGTTFNVMPGSIKHLGGLKNSDTQLFGRTGRPLSSDERDLGKDEIILGKIPVAIVGGNGTGVKVLNVDQLKSIFTKKVANWKQVGGSDALILLGGREPNEAVFKELKVQLPWFAEVTFDKVFKSDNDVDKFMLTPEANHAIIFGAKTQFHDTQIIKIEGVSLGSRVGLVYDNKNKNHPLVEAARKYSQSKEWQSILKNKGWDIAR